MMDPRKKIIPPWQKQGERLQQLIQITEALCQLAGEDHLEEAERLTDEKERMLAEIAAQGGLQPQGAPEGVWDQLGNQWRLFREAEQKMLLAWEQRNSDLGESSKVSAFRNKIADAYQANSNPSRPDFQPRGI